MRRHRCAQLKRELVIPEILNSAAETRSPYALIDRQLMILETRGVDANAMLLDTTLKQYHTFNQEILDNVERVAQGPRTLIHVGSM